MATTKALSTIQQAAIYRCTDKATKEIFYTQKSDSTDQWYTQRFDSAACAWTCDCPASCVCKHLRAVVEVLKIRRARLAQKVGGNMPAIVAQVEQEQEVREEVASATIAAAQAILKDAYAERMAALEKQRDQAHKDGGFSLLK